jgi:hypothetical protein
VIDTVVSDLGNVLLFFDNALFFRRMTRYTERSLDEIRRVTHDNADLLAGFERGEVAPLAFYENACDLLAGRRPRSSSPPTTTSLSRTRPRSAPSGG